MVDSLMNIISLLDEQHVSLPDEEDDILMSSVVH
jgi:hypothetical protein